MVDRHRLEKAYQTTLAALLAERHPDGYWVGELSTSALSTAVAVSALALVQRATVIHGSFAALIDGGLAWLAAHQNADGGWGDTVKSFSNISTTMLCRAAFHLTGTADRFAESLRKADAWLAERYGTTPAELAEAVRARYGKDRTFSVPILMTSALAGLVEWKEVPSLPFELACFPQSWYRFLQIPVVSYALPALIAIGQAVYHHRPPWNPVARIVRRMAIPKSLRVLEAIQPSNGGFLEATPLTAFVTLALASIGRAEHPVVGKAVDFLAKSVRPDGSWPIDTNLSTWVTTLSVNALAAAGDLDKLDKRSALRDWLLAQQYRVRHPYTGADPGAWAWTPLPGGVPDADDTPGALLALRRLTDDPPPDAVRRSVHAAYLWLVHLQNRDWGWPTFCRGWGRLPFDRSGADLTAHALRAIHAWSPHLPPVWPARYYDAFLYEVGDEYLQRTQHRDGSWLPLWFGCQHAADDANPTYGTARVLAAYRDLDKMTTEPARRGVRWLLAAQNADGGWGGAPNTPSSMEETALAVEILLSAGPDAASVVNNGIAWLVQRVESGGLNESTPIGFYFAKLWYFEKLYPIIFTAAALGCALRHTKTA
ncbi:MAG TPA: prenyltransferase/squalene oxidase repeat-containing protein [Gemmataceae bacterium]|nr:prenyltransferase/squalene oxidase repeat-containing protein [Gemmataceae bacterium]